MSSEGTTKTTVWQCRSSRRPDQFHCPGNPAFSTISVGSSAEGQIVAGVISDPLQDEIFFAAEKGQGRPSMNHRRLLVAARQEMIGGRDRLRLPFSGRRATLPSSRRIGARDWARDSRLCAAWALLRSTSAYGSGGAL